MKQFDMIIIGGGLGGLTCGAALATNGKKILLVEKNAKVGGAASSVEYGDFTFDFSLHNFGPVTEYPFIHKIFQETGILNKVDFIPFNEYHRVVFPEHDIIMYQGMEKILTDLQERFPDDAKGLKKVFKIFSKLHKEFLELEESEILIEQLEEKFPMFPMMFPNIIALTEKDLDSFLREYLSSDQLIGILSNLWYFFGVGQKELAVILYAPPLYSYYEYGGGHFKGTSQTYSNALAAVITENSGEVHTNTKAARILLQEGQVYGIETGQGDKFEAPIIISNANTYSSLLEMVGEENLKKKESGKIKRYEQSISAIQIYLGLNLPQEKLGLPTHTSVFFHSYDSNENYQWTLDDNYEKCFLSCINYTWWDPSLTPANKSILNIFTLANYNNWKNLNAQEIETKKKRAIDTILKRVKQSIPAITDDVIEVCEMSTPLYYKDYFDNISGSIYGINQNLEQIGINRQKSITPIKNLYLTGCDTFPGAGHPSVISSGYRLAKYILGQEPS